MTRGKLIEYLLEFGETLELAESTADVLLPLMNDPRGVAQAFAERWPAEAARRGYIPKLQ